MSADETFNQATRGGTMAEQKIVDVTEQKRLNDAREAGSPWKKWGFYLDLQSWSYHLRLEVSP
jgi:hypothetical protein